MKITLFLLFFVAFQAYSENGYSQSTKISIPRSSLKVSELLSKIESQTEYLFVYNKKNVDTRRKPITKLYPKFSTKHSKVPTLNM